jgi:hypothetical protein
VADYNGWKDKATWNCAMWLTNDEPLYRRAVAYAKQYYRDMAATPVEAISSVGLWLDFIADAGMLSATTPDGHEWRAADQYEMGRLMSELADD